MKKVFKIGCLGIIGIVVLIIIAAVAFGGGGDTSTEPSSGGDTSAPAEETAEETKAAVIGDAVEVGDTVFTVNTKETADQVGPSIMPETASGKYVVLNVTFKNNGNEALLVDSSFFKLKMGDKTYEADDMATITANQNEDGSIQTSMFMEEINPDSEVTGTVVFDVNPDVAESELQLQVQSGLFGTETALIDLQ